jgi:hypothetical protein
MPVQRKTKGKFATTRFALRPNHQSASHTPIVLHRGISTDTVVDLLRGYPTIEQLALYLRFGSNDAVQGRKCPGQFDGLGDLLEAAGGMDLSVSRADAYNSNQDVVVLTFLLEAELRGRLNEFIRATFTPAQVGKIGLTTLEIRAQAGFVRFDTAE